MHSTDKHRKMRSRPVPPARSFKWTTGGLAPTDKSRQLRKLSRHSEYTVNEVAESTENSIKPNNVALSIESKA